MITMLLYHKADIYALQSCLVTIIIVVAVFVVAKTHAVSRTVEHGDFKTQDLLMRGAKPEQPEAYICAAYPVSDEKSFIYKFEALANASTAHHILLYGCNSEPYSTQPFWYCSTMCKSEQETILFAWAKNAPPTVLPKGVGVRIGKGTAITTIVLQVHYARAFHKDEKEDFSGIKIYTTQEEQPFVAGIYLMAAGNFEIPMGNPSYPVDMSCIFNKEQSIFPYAYRTHAHKLGVVITGYLYNGSYFEIGKGNPQWPQSFYPVHDVIKIKQGDSIAARCTYDSTSMDHVVSVGSTANDEMCNFYIMYYTDKSVFDPSGYCGSDNIPAITGKSFPADVSVPLPPNHALEEEAATGHHHHGSMTGTEDPKPQGLNTQGETWTLDLLMKGAKPDKPDAYLCGAFPVTNEEAYIYKFEALANASTAHHILVYGCRGEAFSDQPIWQCPAMCRDSRSETILFAWAKNAPPTVLPKDVGLRIGQKSSINTIVVQVHYARAFPADEKPDNSGIRVYITQKIQPFVAGIFFLASGMFSIPPGQPLFPVDISCHFSMKNSIFPFAYRTHAHKLGRTITGYQYNDSYHQIGKGNPQWPQAFYPVNDKIEVKPGDYLAARCTYDSTSMKHKVNVGSTGNDEMCNFYIMFYTDSSVEDPSGRCYSDEFSWLTGDNFPMDVSVPLPPNPELEEEANGHHHSGDSHSETKVAVPANSKILDILIKGANPYEPEKYLISAYSVPDLESYIYKFEPLADSSTVHHMILYGCSGEPFSSQPTWQSSEKCQSDPAHHMYAWSKNSLPTVFPSGVGMRIGQQTQIKTLVLEVYFTRAFADLVKIECHAPRHLLVCSTKLADEPPNYSGIRLYTTQEKPSFVAGLYLMVPDEFRIPPGVSSFVTDSSCKYSKTKSMFPFMFMTHAHFIGKVITGYHYNGSYHEIGKGNPLWPQAFNPVKNKIEVKPGDYLAARCTFDSSNMNRTVVNNVTGNDEMCNLFIMYYTDSSETDTFINCFGNNEQQLTGDNFPSDVSVPLPPNPALEMEASGHHQKGGMGGGADVGRNDIKEHRLEFNSSWSTDQVVLGQIGGVATDMDGNVYIFHRGSREWNAQSFSVNDDFMYKNLPIPEDTIIVLNSQGQLVRTFGAGEYYMPHGIEVDKDGNIWLTDVALHQVFKISRGETKPSLILGHRFEHSTDLSYFCKPTDVAVLSTGEFFVSDGYCNGRVLKFSKTGTLIKAWGEKNLLSANDPPVNTFAIPHSITVSEENQLVCVADRENGRIQCFDLDGNFRYVIKHPEFGTRLFAIEQCPIYGGVLYAVNGPSYSGPPDISVQGFTLDIKTGDILEIWNVPQHLQNPHDVCVHSGSQSVYVGELNPRAVWKLSRLSLTASQEQSVHRHTSTIPGENINGITPSYFNQSENIDNMMPGMGKNNASMTVDKGAKSDNSDFPTSVLIGCLLIVPVIMLLIIILLLRAYYSGKLKCCDNSKLQRIFSKSHKGFDPLKTEESDHDSDQEEYNAHKKIKDNA